MPSKGEFAENQILSPSAQILTSETARGPRKLVFKAPPGDSDAADSCTIIWGISAKSTPFIIYYLLTETLRTSSPIIIEIWKCFQKCFAKSVATSGSHWNFIDLSPLSLYQTSKMSFSTCTPPFCTDLIMRTEFLELEDSASLQALKTAINQ